jgi:SAM-dependent methyltransferase
MSSDADWKKWGEVDPYFGVVTHEEFRRDKLTQQSLDRFFRSGEQHVEHIFQVLRERLSVEARPSLAVDYGCGTGRVTLPLSKRADRALGLDVSEGMLKEAQKNATEQQFGNIDFGLVEAGRRLPLPESIDFVHSYIVFQHIPTKYGERIFAELLGALAPGGAGVMHFTVASRRPWISRCLSVIRNRVPLLHPVLNLLQGKRLGEPRMRMEAYSFERLMDILYQAGIENFYCERTDHGGHIGVTLYFRRPVAGP